jgi:hypothetical protein
MTDTGLRRLTGAAGVLAALAILIEIPLYFVYSGPPTDANVLTRSLFGLVGLTLLTVFMVGLRPLLANRRLDMEPVAVLASTAGLMWVVVQFISNGLETGAVIASTVPIDPTITVSGTYLLYGTITRLIEALFLAAFAYTVVRIRALPRWTAASADVLAVLNLAFVPSIYFGNDPANFYAANGWGTTATMGGLFMLWLLAVGIAVLSAPIRSPQDRAAGPAPVSVDPFPAPGTD